MMSDLNQMNGNLSKTALILGVLPIINEYSLNNDIVFFPKAHWLLQYLYKSAGTGTGRIAEYDAVRAD